MADNPFTITPANPLQALMAGQQGYDVGRQAFGRQSVLQALATGDLKAGLTAAAGSGDYRMMQAIAEFARQQQTGQHYTAMEKLAQDTLKNTQYTQTPEYLRNVAQTKAQVEAEYAPKTTNVKLPGGEEVTAERGATGFKLPAVAGMENVQPNNPFAAGGKPDPEHVDKAKLFADRAATSHIIISKYEKLNRQPGGTIGAIVEKVLPEDISNIVVSGERGELMNSKRAFVNALLRRESGAAINAGEFKSYDKEYFPQLGDTDEQIKNKRLHRAEVIKGLAREGGRNYKPNFALDEAAGTVARPTAKTQTASTPENDRPEIAEARMAIGRGKSRAAVEQRLKELKIPFSSSDLDLQ